jgi:hypothetical protein
LSGGNYGANYGNAYGGYGSGTGIGNAAPVDTGAGSGAGRVSVAQAQTYTAEDGTQLSPNDIHLSGSTSQFTIGPDGKVPSLASQVQPRIFTSPAKVLLKPAITEALAAGI